MIILTSPTTPWALNGTGGRCNWADGNELFPWFINVTFLLINWKIK